jgi:iduronate 2-sulfatase
MRAATSSGGLAALAAVFAAAATANAAASPPVVPNVLFIAVDDLRPEHGVFGGDALTPNIDAFARTALRFPRNYVQIGVCSPSRTSLLTGRYPDTTHITDLWHYFRDVGCNVTTLPEAFRKAGYAVAGGGKIFHPGHASGAGDYPPVGGGCDGCDGYNDPPSWDYYVIPPAQSEWPWNASDAFSSMAVPANVSDSQHPDGQTAHFAAHWLANHSVADPGKPFFLAPGFLKPHLPFIAPQRFFDLYANYTSLAPDADPAADEASLSWTGWSELSSYADISAIIKADNISLAHPSNSMPRDKALELRRGYLAAVSFNDALVGTVLAALDASPFAGNTTVVLWGDHGWQLGDHGDWAKHTNFESVARAPLLIRSPAYPSSAGKTAAAFTQHIDLFPTLLELTGIQPPKDADGLQGESLVPLLNDPSLPALPKRGAVAYTQYPRKVVPCEGLDCGYQKAMGYTLRTSQWRYTEWVPYDNVTYTPNFHPTQPNSTEVELYFHGGDNGGANWTAYESAAMGNVAADPRYGDVVKNLSALLHCGPGLLKPEAPCPAPPSGVLEG